MKKLIILSAIAISGLIYSSADAQIGIHVGFRFRPQRVVYTSAQVAVQPASVYSQSDEGYGDNSDDYYYLPDVDAYYDVTDQCYFYFDGENWVSAAYLPGEYRDYDWRNARRFEVREQRPYMHDDVYRQRYSGQRVDDWVRTNGNYHTGNGYANQGRRQAYSGYAQPKEQNRGYNQAPQPSRENYQRNDNRANSQPSNQNSNRGSDTRGGAEHFAQSHAQNNSANRRMSRF